MHLIHVDSFKLQEFFGSGIPKYAILSHTWGPDEVSFQDMQTGAIQMKQGFEKIMYTCAEAKKRGLRWAWVDTCCIDKTSSAELSEAINSMYQWYQQSSVCFAYLTDVPGDGDLRDEHSPYRRSRWFTRGWTLQELIAPAQVDFYGQGWSFLGDRLILCSLIKSITGIPREVLLGGRELRLFSVAQRMSWASKRQTTRIEDTAYSLLGIFDINMPLLYGEGTKAFHRLQEEILKQTDDQSLFAWTIPFQSPRAWAFAGLLAASPANFGECAEVVKLHKEMGEPSVATKKGVQMHTFVGEVDFPLTSHFHNYCRPPGDRGPRLSLIPLNCSADLPASRIYLLVMRIDPEDTGTEGSSFTRVLAPGLRQVAESPVFKARSNYSRIFITTESTVSRHIAGGIHFHGVPLSLDHEDSSPNSWSLRPWASPAQSASSGLRRHLRLDSEFRYIVLEDDFKFISLDAKNRNNRPSWGIVRPRGDRVALSFFKVRGTSFGTSTPWKNVLLLCGAWVATPSSWTQATSNWTPMAAAGTYIICALFPDGPSLSDFILTKGAGHKSKQRVPAINPDGCAGLLAKVKAKCGDTLIIISVHREHYSDPSNDITQQKPHFIFIFELERVETSTIPDTPARGARKGAGLSSSAQYELEWSELHLSDGEGNLRLVWKYDFIADRLED